MISAQDKILYVANKLGLSTLKDMQASTGAVYDVDTDLSGSLFSNATRHLQPSITNINENQFEVNEALLIETIGFYGLLSNSTFNIQERIGSDKVIVFDLVIGNKRVMKDTPVFMAGSPNTFATDKLYWSGADLSIAPRHQIFMEGAGILIPPQVQWYIDYKVYNVTTGAAYTLPANFFIGSYLFGTRVLLNFNTSI